MTSFDQRIVRYEQIHAVTPENWDHFIGAVPPQERDVILDAGCGYGACTREILQRSKGLSLRIDLIDESEVQLERARKELLPEMNKKVLLTFKQGILIQDQIVGERYDKIFLKMVLHENSASDQLHLLNALYRALKLGGTLIVWDLALHGAVANFFRKVIRKKDEILEFETLLSRRRFLTHQEFSACATQSNFHASELIEKIAFEAYSDRRIADEFHHDMAKYEQWIDYMDELYSSLDVDAQGLLSFRKYDLTLKQAEGAIDVNAYGSHRVFCIERAIWRLTRSGA